MKYRKKPVVIDAIQWLGDNEAELIRWMIPGDGSIVFPRAIMQKTSITIPTREGTMIANPGDWIIRGVKGELYPCKPDIFAATYDAEKTNA
ncbi:MAG: hypothetical protein KF805_12625 [Phycisphaeraceae bacterium]|nr:hypothetical protein [Phycisphaeraceae bacterium]